MNTAIAFASEAETVAVIENNQISEKFLFRDRSPDGLHYMQESQYETIIMPDGSMRFAASKQPSTLKIHESLVLTKPESSGPECVPKVIVDTDTVYKPDTKEFKSESTSQVLRNSSSSKRAESKSPDGRAAATARDSNNHSRGSSASGKSAGEQAIEVIIPARRQYEPAPLPPLQQQVKTSSSFNRSTDNLKNADKSPKHVASFTSSLQRAGGGGSGGGAEGTSFKSTSTISSPSPLPRQTDTNNNNIGYASASFRSSSPPPSPPQRTGSSRNVTFNENSNKNYYYQEASSSKINDRLNSALLSGSTTTNYESKRSDGNRNYYYQEASSAKVTNYDDDQPRSSSLPRNNYNRTTSTCSPPPPPCICGPSTSNYYNMSPRTSSYLNSNNNSNKYDINKFENNCQTTYQNPVCVKGRLRGSTAAARLNLVRSPIETTSVVNNVTTVVGLVRNAKENYALEAVHYPKQKSTSLILNA